MSGRPPVPTRLGVEGHLAGDFEFWLGIFDPFYRRLEICKLLFSNGLRRDLIAEPWIRSSVFAARISPGSDAAACVGFSDSA
jgi:hypothetical protein